MSALEHSHRYENQTEFRRNANSRLGKGYRKRFDEDSTPTIIDKNKKNEENTKKMSFQSMYYIHMAIWMRLIAYIMFNFFFNWSACVRLLSTSDLRHSSDQIESLKLIESKINLLQSLRSWNETSPPPISPQKCHLISLKRNSSEHYLLNGKNAMNKKFKIYIEITFVRWKCLLRFLAKLISCHFFENVWKATRLYRIVFNDENSQRNASGTWNEQRKKRELVSFLH